MADNKKATPPAKKTLSKKAMKSTKGCGGLIVDRSGTGNLVADDGGVMVPEDDCRKAGGTGTDY